MNFSIAFAPPFVLFCLQEVTCKRENAKKSWQKLCLSAGDRGERVSSRVFHTLSLLGALSSTRLPMTGHRSAWKFHREVRRGRELSCCTQLWTTALLLLSLGAFLT